MKRKVSKIAGLIMLMLAVTLIVSDVGAMNVSAAENGTDLYGESYDDVNTLNATVTVKSNILKVKKDNAAQAPKPTKVVVNGVTLKLNKNYTVSYQKYGSDGWEDVKNLTGVGTYRICVTGKGDYTGVSTKRIYVYDPVQRIPMSAVKITVNKVPYTGSAITDGVIKSVKYKNSELVEGKDYTVTYISNVNSGTGIVRISGIESVGYVGERDVKFTITGGRSIAKAKVTGIKTLPYNGPRRQNWKAIKVTVGGKELVYGTDYEEAYYVNNNKAGTAKVVLKGKGSYYGTLTKTFKINKVKLTKDMLDEDSKNIVMQYTGKALKPDVTIYGGDGLLKKGVDYTLTYKNNVKVSDKAMITVKGKGNYTGTLSVAFTITDEKPKAEEPSETKEPDTEVPETKEPETEVPGTEVPDTEVPETNNPETEVPETKEPETEVPDTEVPETKEPETEASSETGKPDDTAEGEDKSEASKPENPTEGTTDGKDDNTSGDGESSEYGTDGDDVVGNEKKTVYEVKPIAFRICSCGAICPMYTYGIPDKDSDPNEYNQFVYECTIWSDHYDENHMEETSYTSASYEKALKYKTIKEDEDGNWMLAKTEDVNRAYGFIIYYHVLDSLFDEQVWNSWLGE